MRGSIALAPRNPISRPPILGSFGDGKKGKGKIGCYGAYIQITPLILIIPFDPRSLY